MTLSSPLRVAVVGVGYLGSRHAETYTKLPGARLVAVCDQNRDRASHVAQTVGCEVVTKLSHLEGRVDAVSIAVPTSAHAEIGLFFLRRGIHVLMEKPLATNLTQAHALLREAMRHHCILQVGHIERFNAALLAAKRYLKAPRFVEVHRLSPYSFRGTDVSVVLDVMIHDLDLLLDLVRAPVTRVDAVGVSVLSPSEDLANARLVFASGCVANLTASRVSDEPLRRFRVFQEHAYLSIDTKEQLVTLAHLKGRTIERVHLPVNKRPPLEEELASFLRAVSMRRTPVVSGEDGRAALALAMRIEHALRQKRQ